MSIIQPVTLQLGSSHGELVAQVLTRLGHEPTLNAAAKLLFVVSDDDTSEAAAIARQAAQILQLATQLRHLIDAPKHAGKNVRDATAQIEQLRRMVLAMATDLRGVLIALGSQLARLRECVVHHTEPDAAWLQEVLQVFSPLANRLGVWQLKWELEDLAFRFAQPEQYHRINTALNAKHEERQLLIETVCSRLSKEFTATHILAKVYGRPKHIYSIANKMALKNLSFESLYDLRAVRVVVNTVRDCYTALGVVHDIYLPITKEFDDYIARPKPNGYKSLHTVIIADDGKPVEVQIRTEAMHEFAEFGVAAHWRYKEGATNKPSVEEAKIAWLRQLLAWKKDLSKTNSENWQSSSSESNNNQRIFCLTPAGRVIELTKGSTPIDFAYALHTDLGHRCRGAKIDGAITPLNTPLCSGQTVEILSDRKHNTGPSRDWLNIHLGYTASNRSRSKVRAWFNALAHNEAIIQGRAVIDRELARLGKTAASTVGGLAQLAKQMGYEDTQFLFIAANKTNFNTRTVELALESLKVKEISKQTVNKANEYKASEHTLEHLDSLAHNRINATAARVNHTITQTTKTNGDVWVVGVDMLLTQLAQCCRPVPPDAVIGYITRGKGISLHRKACGSLQHLAIKSPERIIECAWNPDALNAAHHNNSNKNTQGHYTVNVKLTAIDRPGLLRDVSDAFNKHKINITALNTQNKKGESRMALLVMVNNIDKLNTALISVRDIKGVLSVIRC
jgi:GTP pyrophosphokinase